MADNGSVTNEEDPTVSVELVDPEHLHVLIHAGLPRGAFVLRWTTPNTTPPSVSNGITEPNGTRYRELRPATVDAVGQMLLDANAASIAASWGGENTYVYSYQQPRAEWSPVEILRAINGYTHQACETETWPTSEAARFCAALRDMTIRRLPDYDRGPSWLITADAVPLAVTRAELAARHRINHP